MLRCKRSGKRLYVLHWVSRRMPETLIVCGSFGNFRSLNIFHMNEKLKQSGLLKLGKELSKNEMKKVVGGDSCYTVCTGGTYFGFCQASYCTAVGHGRFVFCVSRVGGVGLLCLRGLFRR